LAIKEVLGRRVHLERAHFHEIVDKKKAKKAMMKRKWTPTRIPLPQRKVGRGRCLVVGQIGRGEISLLLTEHMPSKGRPDTWKTQILCVGMNYYVFLAIVLYT